MSSSLRRGDLLPRISTQPPGPRSRELVERLGRVEAPGISTDSIPDGALVWAEARGANVVDVDGNRYVDLTAGFGVAAIGHRHPRVVRAIRHQSTRLIHAMGDVAAHEARLALAEALGPLLPLDDPRIYPAVSGSDAVEIALKTALLATGREGILAFDPSYHGLTLGSLAVTSRPSFRDPFGARITPHVHRLPWGAAAERVEEACAAEPAVGCVILEPIVGREGVHLPPPGWIAEVAAIAREAGALVVVDEIFTGFARTGTLFAIESEGVRPDLICLGKALGGGLPIGVTAGTADAMSAWPADGEPLHTATFLGHPLASAAAVETLSIFEDEELVARAADRGEELAARFRAWSSRWGDALRLRGRGMLWGLELDDSKRARRIARTARSRGVLVLPGGPGGRVLQLAPPLVITERQLDHSLDVLFTALEVVLDQDGMTGDPPAASGAFKLAFVGSHGVGKTTLCYGLAARLKARDVSLDVVGEVARRCPLPINRETTVDAQAWILHTQIAEEILSASRYDLLICDRSVLDNFVYLLLSTDPPPGLAALVDSWLATYDLLVHIPVTEPPSDDGLPATDPAFQRLVEDRLRREISGRGVRVLELHGTRREGWLDEVEREVHRRLASPQLQLL